MKMNLVGAGRRSKFPVVFKNAGKNWNFYAKLNLKKTNFGFWCNSKTNEHRYT